MADLEAASGRPAIGFRAAPAEGAADDEQIQARLRELLGEETVAAVPQVVIFCPLAEAALSELAQIGLERLAKRAVPVIFDESIAPWLAAQAAQVGTGRLALERLLRDQVAAPVHAALETTPPGSGEVLFVEFADSALRCHVVQQPS